MTLAPRGVMDLALAPVAARIDLNLQRIRDKEPYEVEAELELELDKPPIRDTREQRAAHVLQFAT